MKIRETVQQGSKPKRQNGDARCNDLWPVNGVEEPNKLRISYLANCLGTTNAATIDFTSQLLLKELNIQDQKQGRKGNTFSQTLANYLSVLDGDGSPFKHQAVLALNKRVQKREEARYEFMVITGAECLPDASLLHSSIENSTSLRLGRWMGSE